MGWEAEGRQYHPQGGKQQCCDKSGETVILTHPLVSVCTAEEPPSLNKRSTILFKKP